MRAGETMERGHLWIVSTLSRVINQSISLIELRFVKFVVICCLVGY